MFTPLIQHHQRWYGIPMTHTTPPPKYDIDRFAEIAGAPKVEIADRAGVSRSVLYRAAAGEGLSASSARKLYDAYPHAAMESGLVDAFVAATGTPLPLPSSNKDNDNRREEGRATVTVRRHAPVGDSATFSIGPASRIPLPPKTQADRIAELETRVAQLEATLDGLLRGMIGVLADHLTVGGGRRHG